MASDRSEGNAAEILVAAQRRVFARVRGLSMAALEGCQPQIISGPTKANSVRTQSYVCACVNALDGIDRYTYLCTSLIQKLLD
jgi:hypothetical protein